MTNKNKLILLMFAILLLPILFYLIRFHGCSFSRKTETWGQFGDYLNGTFMPIIALAGVLVTLVLGIISDKRNEANIKIGQQKRRPLLHIGYSDFDNKINIFMKNKGDGPLIINDFKIVNIETKEFKSGIFDCLPAIERHYNNYTGNQKNTVLSANEETNLFLFELGNNENEISIERIRESLSKFKIVVDYNDVYDNRMPTYERSLEWLGRNLVA